ncbi:MAG: hypothetical protein EPN14_01060 [Gallionella sp.]|nr:MAG: hypothetical protein EPN14_01060 [Gallionella sp.]
MKPISIPKPVGSLLSLLPQYPNSVLFAQALNFILKPMLSQETLQQLQGKLYCISVADAGMKYYFTVTSKGFIARHRAATPDLTISASTFDFVMLATRREDPDTLFFSRRLVVEGDTELGLLVKNSLDALELPFQSISDVTPLKLAELLKSRVLSAIKK